ncbi:MAG: hypothetical protein UU16_C0001G0034 [Candidatus Woesebacteria bacterium GW2011_GWA2_40_7]|nr:MAG: hypothetical protein UU16_C0001G0034 [Candidatus Woesebacteria bacterium GW2011_GWA2_40_7]KKS90765.1 MAG: hypothetical protein UV66_C0001G0122 [Candidatus Woesebacteria bacterium GW2011_GWA1_43_12]
MQNDGGGLPKINLDEKLPIQTGESSILVPKIEVLQENVSPQPQVKSGKTKKVWLMVLIFFSVFLIYNLVVCFLIYQKGVKLATSLNQLSVAAQSKDLAKIKVGLDQTNINLGNFRTAYKFIFWAKILPFVGPYVKDGDHAATAAKAGIEAGQIVVTTIEPYSDLLGLQGGVSPILGAKTGEQTTQDRIDFIIKTIPDLLPKIDSISAKAKTINDEISQIVPNRYPEVYKGKKIRSQIKTIQGLVEEVSGFIVNGKPMLENAPYILGMDSPRTYMILFQNDKEIRPTGGFMTAYAMMKVDKAKFEPVSSNDIYNLDAQYKPSIRAPEPIIKYIKGPYILSQNLRLRDMNWSPDFGVSMQTFSSAISKLGLGNIDGIIAVDTQLLTNLLDAIGPIGVPGFGNFSTKIDPECSCPQVIHELESFADIEGPIIWDPLTGKIILRPPNSDNRKRIIGPLMNSILANAFGQPKEKLPALFEAGFKSLIEKHVLFYIFDPKVETAVSDFGLGGTIRNYDGDYLHVNDANLGGRKSNLYATEDVNQDIKIGSDGTVTKTLTITYKNPMKQDGWLNSVLPTWVRVYVPQGSTLITSEGLDAKTDPYDDLGKTVFAGFFQLRPEGVSKITFEYKLPFKVSKNYKLLIQKQPGTDGFLYLIKLGKHSEEFYLKTDKELKIGL